MKKIICVLLIAVMATIGLTGCLTDEELGASEIIVDNRFEMLPYEEETSVHGCFNKFFYLRDTITDVVYVYVIYGTGNGRTGSLTILFDADGTPILYDEFMESLEDR